MSDDDIERNGEGYGHGEGHDRGHDHSRGGYGGDPYGGWQPTPQGEYDADATAFVQLPEGGFPAAFAQAQAQAQGEGQGQGPTLSDFDDVTPLAAPGNGGFVPPQISVLPGAATDPAATGMFVVPTMSEQPRQVPEPAQPEAVSWPEPNAPQPPAPGPEAYDPGATGQWSFTAEPEPTHVPDATDVTGQWSIPVAGGDLPDESGEFTQSSLVEQWGGNAPATLPGGAPAPWAPEVPPEPEPEPVAEQPQKDVQEEAPVQEEPVQEAPVPEALVSEEQPLQEDVREPQSAAEPVQEEAAQEEQAPPATPALNDQQPLVSYVLHVNGADRPVTDAWIGESLLYVLRERLGLAGAKDGCSQGECGACAVQVDGRLVASCLVPAATTAGSEVRTVEGLAEGGRPSDVQRALASSTAVQCGFCVPGMAMTVHDLLEGNPAPTDRETRQALCGNLCRCSGYKGVLDAVQQVVAEREATRAPEAPDGGGAEETDARPAAPRIPHQSHSPDDGNRNHNRNPGQNPHQSQNPHQNPHQSQNQDGGPA